MYESILVPTDGSEATVETLRHALDLARRHEATVHALYVIDERMFNGFGPDRRAEAREVLESKGERAVEEVRTRAEEQGLACQTFVRQGAPSEAILAHESEVDAIVIGTHGTADHERHVGLGSVASRVVEHTTVPVLVVHIGADTEP